MRVLGIDPGVTGAWAVIELDKVTGKPRLLEIGDLPVKAFKMSKRTTHRIDVKALGDLLEELTAYDYETDTQGFDRICVERLSGGPGITSSTSFSLGWTAATIDTVLTTLGLAHDTVPPSAWKRSLLVPADKSAAKRRATMLFGHDKGWPREKDHNRAEAAMIALYGALR
jgi:crossover junction endodeoxyribonuclease RuvC